MNNVQGTYIRNVQFFFILFKVVRRFSRMTFSISSTIEQVKEDTDLTDRTPTTNLVRPPLTAFHHLSTLVQYSIFRKLPPHPNVYPPTFFPFKKKSFHRSLLLHSWRCNHYRWLTNAICTKHCETLHCVQSVAPSSYFY